MAQRLLDRQVSLVEYMTSGAAIFGGQRGRCLAQALRGIDPGLLKVEAHFAHAKRMEKITAVLPRTFELMGSSQGAVVREFVETCPPVTISRLSNARQFYDFLSARWTRERPDPPFIRDVAACELACAEVDGELEDRGLQVDQDERYGPRSGIRRSPAAILLRCAYDIRPIFEGGAGQAVPIERATPLVVVLSPGTDRPQVFEVPPAVFDLLAALNDWTDPPTSDAGPEVATLLAQLTKYGLIEVQR
jgi:hypothetical protein